MGFKSARLKAGRKVQEVVDHLGVTDGAVYQWECGYSRPTAAKLIKLADFYGCTVDELLREEDTNAEGEG